ncbi:unnamed protein product, partial [Rotaria magnacalcarata]
MFRLLEAQYFNEVKPKRPPLPPTYVNVPSQPPVRPREPSPTMDPDA